MKKWLALLFAVLVTPAQAQIFASYPYTFQNGTIADATQVNANFNAISLAVNAGAAHNGTNSDITYLTGLIGFSATTGSLSGAFTVSGISTYNGVAVFASDITMTGTGEIDVPSGTTAQRSASPSTGMFRYNTSTATFEGYGGATNSWQVIGPASGFCMASGLQINNDPTTPNTKVDISANFMQLANYAGNSTAFNRSAVSLVINAATTGANGLDTGALAATTWYYVWVIDNGTTTAGLLSLSATAPTLPSGYVYGCRWGAVKTDGSSILFRTLQKGAKANWVVTASTNTSTLPLILSGAGTTTVATLPFVPPTATQLSFSVAQSYINGCTLNPNSTYGVLTSATNPAYVSVSGQPGISSSYSSIPATFTLESTNVYYVAADSTCYIRAYGWTDNVLAF